jgi:hypothetical protein
MSAGASLVDFADYSRLLASIVRLMISAYGKLSARRSRPGKCPACALVLSAYSAQCSPHCNDRRSLRLTL